MRVGFLTYSKTAQESCLRLMGKKLLVSLALEGKLQGDGLQSMDDDDDLLTAMARELVTRQGVGELAAEVWKNLQAQRGDVSEQSSVTLFPPDERPDAVPDPDVVWSRTEPTAPAVQLSLF